jgi:hypothetical protein
MPRTAETPGAPATNRVQVLLTDTDMAALDEQRGTIPVSAYLRNLIRRHLDTSAHTAAPGTTASDGHRHTPGELVAQRTVKGVTTRTYRCKDCDKTMERRA